jgi:predicted site-specific integrase-resolvase
MCRQGPDTDLVLRSRAAPADTIRHLTSKELGRRWNMSFRSLERWRVRGKGPPYIRINGRCRYRLEDIEAFEREHMRDRAANAR